MIHFDLPKQKSSIIKVLGVGGGGSNAVNFMYAQDIEGVDFIICNTDAKALEQSRIPNKIQLGPYLTQGLGAGANPEVGKQATEESLEEIKRILEVNTKMAFICAGMGGGTGTGGAPIIAKICRDLGILTVAIVTTPFGFEGPRRHQQAESGIKQLEPYVDTLLVISNDKLRIQYGNLKMREAFSKADNVLATAAKCITDIINSRGHIIVDFADVCTVMKNGGVAILGSAAVEGEERAQRAIEEALSSPLLNDNDISGAKWILININSAEGEDECTMDELEIINSYLRRQTGEATDVIVGMGYDATLGKKIGITLIATGFEHKDPFSREEKSLKKPEATPEKIVMTLGIDGEENKMYNKKKLAIIDKDPFAPSLVENENIPAVILPLAEENATGNVAEKPEKNLPVKGIMENIQDEIPAAQKAEEPKIEMQLISGEIKEQSIPAQEEEKHIAFKYEEKTVEKKSFVQASFLNKPLNIYAEMPKEKPAAPQSQIPVEPKPHAAPEVKPAEEATAFELIMKDEPPAETEQNLQTSFNITNEEEDQKRKAAERLHKLRNLSFNMSNAETNNEFDSVPAYVRRNMDLFGNTLTSVENFYSKYTVKKEPEEQAHISTINTFLDGKKPD